MRLTEKKLFDLWNIRKQIFNNPVNSKIISRYNEVASLFQEIRDCDLSFNEETNIYT